jgi:hypothetical protein
MSPSTVVLLLITALFVKHFFIDFPMQKPYQWMNKGTYGHPGGLVHASLHSLGTFLVLIFFTGGELAVMLALLDGVIHYHVDWAKMNINKRMGWTATTHAEFWTLVGLDQLLHALTYIGIVWILI